MTEGVDSPFIAFGKLVAHARTSCQPDIELIWLSPDDRKSAVHQAFTIALCALSLLSKANAASPTQSDIEIKGYKTVIFGISVDEVASLGNYKCDRTDYGLRNMDSASCSATDTIFGLRASVHVLFRNGLAYYVGVTARDTKPIDLIKAFEASLGKARIFITPNLGGHPIQVAYWLSRSGTSVSVKRNLVKPDNGPRMEFGVPIYSESVTFSDRASTSDLLRREGLSHNPGKDF